MSKYIQRPCPAKDCDSSDAFTIYEDGAKCFSCGFSSGNIMISTTVNPQTGDEKEYHETPCPNCGHSTIHLGHCNHCRVAAYTDGTFRKPLRGKEAQEAIKRINGG